MHLKKLALEFYLGNILVLHNIVCYICTQLNRVRKLVNRSKVQGVGNE